ncbi:MAG TPA: DUF4294 domain-containing protein [Bacteroidia bacterium]|jgi:hypothetical protein|nr:DUF4294 domain-containing protein [Bacteroidia bacterium]
MPRKLIFTLLFLPLFTLAQQEPVKTTDSPVKGVSLPAHIVDGDTLPYINLAPVICTTTRVFKNKKEQQRWERTKYNVKKVYPYAILAAAKLKEYDRILATIPTQRERDSYMKEAEDHLTDEFGEELKKLTVTQGRILIKLIDRETGKTTYDVVKSMRGNFSAYMWQGIALMFNSNLKADYDAEGDDKSIELAIRLVEDGQF